VSSAFESILAGPKPGQFFGGDNVHGLYRTAQSFISVSRMVGAAIGGAFGAMLLLLALWVLYRSGGHWFFIGLALFLGLWGGHNAYSAIEIFLSTQPNQPPPPRRPMSIETRKEDQERRARGRRGGD
jgi:hypothetical protein